MAADVYVTFLEAQQRAAAMIGWRMFLPFWLAAVMTFIWFVLPRLLSRLVLYITKKYVTKAGNDGSAVVQHPGGREDPLTRSLCAEKTIRHQFQPNKPVRETIA